MISNARNMADAGVAAPFEPNPLDIVLRVTALTTAFYAGGFWYLAIPAKMICAAMLVFPFILRSTLPWTALLIVMTFSNGVNWFVIDNHKYLLTYWLLAVALALSAGMNTRAVLSFNGHWMIVLCFAFAFLWKLTGGEYLNGKFFTFTFLTDPRFAVPVSALTGVDLAILEANRGLIGFARTFPTADTVVSLKGIHEVYPFAIFASYWTLLIEFGVAVSWAMAAHWRRVQLFADILLLVFILTTYVLAPVVGFATLLCLFGLATTINDRSFSFRCLLYVIAVGVIQLSGVPWGKYVAAYL